MLHLACGTISTPRTGTRSRVARFISCTTFYASGMGSEYALFQSRRKRRWPMSTIAGSSMDTPTPAVLVK